MLFHRYWLLLSQRNFLNICNMSVSHLQVNKNGTIEDRRTLLWPSSKVSQKDIIKSLFETDSFHVDSINNISGSFWKLSVSSVIASYNINLYISSIRDEDRSNDEFKMQLGGSYPTGEESGWITLIMGIYSIDNGDGTVDYVLCGYRQDGYNFSTNPSLRGTRTSHLQKAHIVGLCKTERTVLFRPEYIYYYIQNFVENEAMDDACSNETYIETITIDPIEVTPIMKNFIEALKTKPFLLLAGISGTGKSQKVKELAFLTCPKDGVLNADSTTPGNYCLIEVKPNWHDSTDLLGYYSNLTEKYTITPFLHFVHKAAINPNVPFFVCLDEMNLAPVEQYFAEYLSVLETRTMKDGKIETAELLSKKLFESCSEDRGYTDAELDVLRYLKDNGLRLPENLFVIGTVNMDDTTHQFSRKVIDRAFTIEMNGDELEEMFADKNAHVLDYTDTPLPLSELKPKFVKANDALADEVVGIYKDVIIAQVPEKLKAINAILKDTPFRVSYRVQNEFVLYLSTLLLKRKDEDSIDELINKTALVILLEKILPRVQGDEKLLSTADGNVFTDLRNYVKENLKCKDETGVFSEVIAKLDEMDKRLSNTYFANFF